jgi:hypothetical protein
MKKARFTEGQMNGVLREHVAGAAADACREHGISSATFYKWKPEYGGLKVDQAQRLKDLAAWQLSGRAGCHPSLPGRKDRPVSPLG